MSSDFAGAGGPPPAKTGGGGNWPAYGFTEKVKGKNKEGKDEVFDRRIPTWRLKVGQQGKRICLLDPPGPENRISVFIHDFTGPDGKFGSQLASIHRSDPAGDPLNDVLGEPSWYWALTGIDMDQWTNPKNQKVYGARRCLVLVRDKSKDKFLSMEKMGGGLRGYQFVVGRDNDKQSAKIGTEWDPQPPKLSDQEMMEKFAKDAEGYGLPVDRFIQPFDYKAIFKPLGREKLLAIANEIRAHREAAGAVQVATGDDEAVPF